MVLWISALSRISRNLDKLLHTLEFLIAHNATVLTTNYMIRGNDAGLYSVRSIEASSSGAPDIEGTRATAGEHPDVGYALSGLVSMRASTNQLSHHRVHVVFLGETHRQVDLLLDYAKRSPSLCPKERPPTSKAS